jgi:hypothetical protein
VRPWERSRHPRQPRRAAAAARQLALGDVAALRRVERIANAVADKVDRRDDEDHRDAREDDAPPVEEPLVLCACEDVADARELGIGAAAPERDARKAQKRERRLEDDHARGQHGRRDRGGADHVRQNVTPDDPPVAGAHRERRLDVLLLAHDERRAAYDACNRHP